MKRKLFVTFLISLCLLFTACGNSNKQQAEIELTPENAIEYFRVDKRYHIEEPEYIYWYFACICNNDY